VAVLQTKSNTLSNTFTLIYHFYVDAFLGMEQLENGNFFLITVAPDAIHHHIKTCRTNMKNMHFVAPEYGSKCIIVNIRRYVDLNYIQIIYFFFKIPSHLPLIFIRLGCVLWKWPRWKFRETVIRVQLLPKRTSGRQ